MDNKPYDDFGYKGNFPLPLLIISIVLFASMIAMIKKGLWWVLIVTAVIVLAVSVIWLILPFTKKNTGPPLTMIMVTISGAIFAMIDRGLGWIFLILLFLPFAVFITWLIVSLNKESRHGNTPPPTHNYDKYMKQTKEKE